MLNKRNYGHGLLFPSLLIKARLFAVLHLAGVRLSPQDLTRYCLFSLESLVKPSQHALLMALRL
jgi:hypothetical protein